jgi:hypothetical protein
MIRHDSLEFPERVSMAIRRGCGKGEFAPPRRMRRLPPALPSPSRSGREGGAGNSLSPPAADIGMQRVQDLAWPIVGLAAAGVSSWLLFRELRGLSLASLRDPIIAVPPTRWLLAILSTSVAYVAFLEGMPDVAQANVVAALLVFRLLYLIVPFIFALGVLLVFERHRWRALMRLQGDRPHAVGDHD